MAAKQAKNNTTKPAPQKAAPTMPVKKEPAGERGKKRLSVRLVLALLLGVISFVLYANTLKNGYVLDDSSAVAENKLVMKGMEAIPELLSTPYHRGYVVTSNDLYRPLSLVMLSLEYQFFGPDPAANHLANVLLFAGCVISLFFFLDRFFERKKIAVAFIASLLFALHPVHTEVVANIKSSDELLCFLFAFLSLNLFLQYMQEGKTGGLLLGSFCFLLSLLSKETVITFLAVIPLVFFFYRNEQKKRGVYITACAAIVAVLFLCIRFSVLSAYDANHITDIAVIDNALAMPGLSFESRIATAVLVLGKYLGLLFVPWPLICDYSYRAIPFVHFGNVWVISSLAVYCLLAFYGIKDLLKNRKDPFAFAILFFLITIFLFSNIPFLIGATMGERFLFFGSVGFCLAVALLIEKWVGAMESIAVLKSPKVLAILIPVSLAFAVITFGRNSDWADNYTLYKTDLGKSPNSARLNYYYGLELVTTMATNEKDAQKQNDIRKEGIACLSKAVAIQPDFSDAQAALGNTYVFFAQYDSAEVHEQKAYDLYPFSDKTISNLAYIYYKTKKFPESIALSKKAIALNPGFVNPYTNMGRCYLSMGKADSAVYILRKAISVDAGNVNAYMVLSYYFQATGQTDSAAKYNAIVRNMQQRK